jgi:hypothetical protein
VSVPNHTSWRQIFWIATPFLFAIALGIAFLSLCTVVQESATYGQLTFYGENGEYYGVRTPDDGVYRLDPAKCNLYIQLPNHPNLGPIAINHLPERLLGAPFYREQSDGERYDTVYKIQYASFYFKNGTLTAMYVNHREIPFTNRKDGVLLTFPIACSRLHKEFGRPDRRESVRERERFRVH